jgi:hypothetical protein
MNNTYAEGDLVEAVKGDAVVRGRIYDRSFNAWAINEFAAIEHYERNGFTVTVIEKAKPKVVLPTEPGWYMARYGRSNYSILQLCADDDCPTPDVGPHWYHPTDRRNLSAEEVTDYYLPLERFDARAVTAKTVLAAVAIDYGRMSKVDLIEKVGKQFGVTS